MADALVDHGRRPRVSVCIPAYARPAELREAILSVLAQDFADFEVVVSDDSGGLRAVVDAIGDGRVRYFRNAANLGMAGNYTAALNRARGDYVGILDDDDWLMPGFLTAVVSRLDADPSLGVAFTGKLRTVGSGLRRACCGFPEGRYERFLDVFLRDRPPIAYPAGLMRQEVWRQSLDAGPLPDLITADAYLWIRPAQLGWPFYYVDRPLLVYRDSPTGVSKREELMRDHGVRLWEGIRFPDEAHERARRRLLARALMFRSTTHLKRGRLAEAAVDARRAGDLAGDIERGRRTAVRVGTRYPSLIPRMSGAWERTRPIRGLVRRSARGI